jgi:hypothetical protein
MTQQLPPEPEFEPVDEFEPIEHLPTLKQPAPAAPVNTDPLPEAGGIAFTTLYTAKGAAINVTARAIGPKQALRELVDCITWATSEYDMTTDKPQPPAAPAATPNAAGELPW